MPTLTLRTTRDGLRLHQKNWETALTQSWHWWRRLRARHSQRRALRDLADDSHLLADIGMTREQALAEANRPFFDLTDVRIHSS
jgi:uncharacterized protein YjiS (DUF1127 family)